MSDPTVHAQDFIAAVARAFYEDDAILVVDVLLRDLFLRDDDMGPRLSLPAKQLRRTLQFLQDEHVVKFELVDDLSSGGSQATKFWYIDYNHAVNTIRLRLHLLKEKLEAADLRARSSSFYLCPGYKEKRCNGRYTEIEALQVVDQPTGRFLCHECVETYENNPNPPPMETYTLQLVDNTKDLKLAVDNMRRVHVQLSQKMIGSHQIRVGIYDLLQKVSKSRGPLSSNLPSENFALGIGSKRLDGTGRTAGIKAKKLAQQGVVVGADKTSDSQKKELDYTFLKNAIGQEVAFTVAKGGGARASLLASNRRMRQKLMDAAASRIGADLSLPLLMEKRERERLEMERAKKKQKTNDGAAQSLAFLENNIGRTEREVEEERQREIVLDEDNGHDMNEERVDGIVLPDGAQELQALSDEERRTAFQAQYKMEMDRQRKILDISDGPPQLTTESSSVDPEEGDIAWEDG